MKIITPKSVSYPAATARLPYKKDWDAQRGLY